MLDVLGALSPGGPAAALVVDELVGQHHAAQGLVEIGVEHDDGLSAGSDVEAAAHQPGDGMEHDEQIGVLVDRLPGIEAAIRHRADGSERVRHPYPLVTPAGESGW